HHVPQLLVIEAPALDQLPQIAPLGTVAVNFRHFSEDRGRTAFSQQTLDSQVRVHSAFANQSEHDGGGPRLRVGIHRLGAAPDSVGSRKRAARIGPYLVGAVGSQPASFLNQDVTARRNGLYVPIVVGEFDGAARLDRSAAEAG